MNLQSDKVTRCWGDKLTKAAFAILLSPCHVVTLSLLIGCGGAPKPTTPPGDLELTQQLSTARAAFNRGAWPQAASLYGLALKRAEAMDNASELANTAYNYAATLVQAGRYDDAWAVLLEARAEAQRAGISIADVTVLQSRTAHLQGRPDDAIALADAVLSDKSASADVRLQAVLVKGEVASEQKDLPAARAALSQTKPLIAAGTTPSLAAGIAELEGAIALLENNPAAAAERFDRQAAFLQRAKLYNDMSRALALAGDAYAAANQPAPAADRFYRAARSALALNEPTAARPWLEAASRNADPAMAERIANLRKSLPATQPVK